LFVFIEQSKYESDAFKNIDNDKTKSIDKTTRIIRLIQR
jgi:hypothetical protein